QAIADKFPGKTITLVSGYRPASKGSPHQAARAMDIRIDGVTNEALVAFCKTLNDTGCGYYPNSYFVHVDVRPEGAGHVSWIDVSGPGETPIYVKQWPLPLPTKPQITKAPLPEPAEAPKTEAATTTDPSQIGDLTESSDESSTTN
ncbi:MAG: YcbK family protein, partial [Polyangiales bacterium]